MEKKSETNITGQIMRDYELQEYGSFRVKNLPICSLDKLAMIASVAVDEDAMILQIRERARCESQENKSERVSGALKSLRELNAMNIICKLVDEVHHDYGDLEVPELKNKVKTGDLDFKKDESGVEEATRKNDHSDLGFREHGNAVASESLWKNDVDDDVDFFDEEYMELGFKKMVNSERKKTKCYDLEGYYLPEEVSRKKELMVDGYQRDLAKKRKRVSLYCKEDIYSSYVDSRQNNNGVQIRENHRKSYENDVDRGDENCDSETKKRKIKGKGKGLMVYNDDDDDDDDWVSLNHKEDISSSYAMKSRRNSNGVQIRENQSRTYEEEVDDEDCDFESKKNKNKGKGFMVYNGYDGDLSYKRRRVSFDFKETRRNDGVLQSKSSNEEDDADYEVYFGSESKKRKSKSSKMNGGNMKKKHGSSPPSSATLGLPEEFKAKIASMGGIANTVRLVFQKRLFASDLVSQQNRFSIPNNQLLSPFLDQDEMYRMEFEGEQMDITVIDPMVEEELVHMTMWSYKKNCKSFVLNSRWTHVAEKNGLRVDDFIQVWSFRDGENNLHFALVKREEDGDGVRDSSSSNANSSVVLSGVGTSGVNHAEEDGITTVGVVAEVRSKEKSTETSMEDID